MSEDIRVLVVDDTVTYRQLNKRIIDSLDGCEVVGTAPNGKIALSKLQTQEVDLVVLDIEMPEMDGLETLAEIRKRYPNVGVVMVSGKNTSSAESTVKALENGALDFIAKPDGGDPADNELKLKHQLDNVVRLFAIRLRARMIREGKVPRVKEVRPTIQAPTGNTLAAAVRRQKTAPIPPRINVVGIGISTGGPNALSEFIPRLPANLPVPVLVVQHMPPMFTASLAKSLDKKSAISVTEAQEGDLIEPGHVYIAPGGSHMVVRRDISPGRDGLLCVGLSDAPPENSCRPAVDVLFRSIATHYGGNMMAVIMTGMGSDGMKGVAAMKQRGCLCLTQDEASCTIYGMPQAVVDAGLSDEVVPLSMMAQRIVDRIANTGVRT